MGDRRNRPGFGHVDPAIDGADPPAFGDIELDLPVPSSKPRSSEPHTRATLRREGEGDAEGQTLRPPDGGLPGGEGLEGLGNVTPTSVGVAAIRELRTHAGADAEPPSSRPPQPVLSTLTARHSIPRILEAPEEIASLPIDHRAGFLLAHIDGIHTMEEILDICAMPPEEALELINKLVKMGVVGIE